MNPSLSDANSIGSVSALWTDAISAGIVDDTCLLCDPKYNSQGGWVKALRSWLEFKKLKAGEIEEVRLTEFESEVLAFINGYTSLSERSYLLVRTIAVHTNSCDSCLGQHDVLPAIPDMWHVLEHCRSDEWSERREWMH